MKDLMDKAGESFVGFFVMVFMICWSFGGLVGAIYWAVKEEILDVVLSIFIPMYGAISVFFDLI